MMDRCETCDGDGVTGTSPGSPPCPDCEPELRAEWSSRQTEGRGEEGADDQPPEDPVLRCPECGAALAWDDGDPGNVAGPPDSWEPPEPEGWRCPECGVDAEDSPDRDPPTGPGEPIYTNSRGGWTDGRTLHGLYAERWVAWSGPFLAYGSTEERAVARLVADMADPQEERRKTMAWYSATEVEDAADQP